MTTDPRDERSIRHRLCQIKVLLERMRQHPEASTLRTALIEAKAVFERLLAAESCPEQKDNRTNEEECP